MLELCTFIIDGIPDKNLRCNGALYGFIKSRSECAISYLDTIDESDDEAIPDWEYIESDFIYLHNISLLYRGEKYITLETYNEPDEKNKSFSNVIISIELIKNNKTHAAYWRSATLIKRFGYRRRGVLSGKNSIITASFYPNGRLSMLEINNSGQTVIYSMHQNGKFKRKRII